MLSADEKYIPRFPNFPLFWWWFFARPCRSNFRISALPDFSTSTVRRPKTTKTDCYRVVYYGLPCSVRQFHPPILDSPACTYVHVCLANQLTLYLPGSQTCTPKACSRVVSPAYPARLPGSQNPPARLRRPRRSSFTLLCHPTSRAHGQRFRFCLPCCPAATRAGIVPRSQVLRRPSRPPSATWA